MFPNMAWALFAAGTYLLARRCSLPDSAGMAYFIQDTTVRTGIVAM
jgi:hypothetical protein